MKMLNHSNRIRNILQRNGWVIERKQGDNILVTHSQIENPLDERANACCRLETSCGSERALRKRPLSRPPLVKNIGVGW
jgi:hypothetical protein